jgi:predicted nucleic acid-binding protein
MSVLAFFDTNVLVYMHDPRAAYKRDVALHFFRRHLYDETLVISTQVVQEFYPTVSRKLENIKSGQGAPMISSASRWDIVRPWTA